MGRSDQIRIRGLDIYARHGVYKEEKALGQHFLVDAVLYTDTEKAGNTDELSASTDYGKVCRKIEQVMTEQSFDLIEAAAEHTAREILLTFPLITRVELELHKPQAPIPMTFSDVSVKIDRAWHTAYIALGSNMGDKKAWLELGLNGINAHPLCRVERTASLYLTAPYGGVQQEDFLNTVCEVRTLLSPEELLAQLQRLEQEAGRVRLVHWGPRTLDLDILFYDDLILTSPRLTVPHPDMENRDFVLVPLCEIAPGLLHPVYRVTVGRMLKDLQEKTACVQKRDPSKEQA